MLRRTKASTETGKPLLELPERIVDVIKCQFDEEEQAFYNALESKVQLSVSKVCLIGECEPSLISWIIAVHEERYRHEQLHISLDTIAPTETG